jgi:hypothetical protein
VSVPVTLNQDVSSAVNDTTNTFGPQGAPSKVTLDAQTIQDIDDMADIFDNMVDIVSLPDDAVSISVATDPFPSNVFGSKQKSSITSSRPHLASIATTTAAKSQANTDSIFSHKPAGSALTSSGPTTNKPPAIFNFGSLNLGLPPPPKSSGSPGKIVVDFGADTSDLSNLKRKPDALQQAAVPSSSGAPPVEEHQRQLPTGVVDTPTEDIVSEVQSAVLSDVPAITAEMPPNAVNVVVDTPPAQAPQFPEALLQAQAIIMKDIAEKYQDLLTKIAAVEQSGKDVLALEKKVGAFGNISGEAVTKRLVEHSGMATVPEEQAQLDVLPGATSEEAVVERQAEHSGMAAVPEEQAQSDVLPEDASEEVLSTEVAELTDTSDMSVIPTNDQFLKILDDMVQPFPESLDDDLAGLNGRIAQHEAQGYQGRSMHAANNTAILHHGKEPGPRPTPESRIAKLSARILRFIREWEAEIVHDLPDPFTESVEDLIDMYYDIDKTDNTQALNDLRTLQKQWIGMRGLIPAWKALRSHFNPAPLDKLRRKFTAWNTATPDSNDKEKLFLRLKKHVDLIGKAYERTWAKIEKLHEAVPALWAFPLGDQLKKDIGDCGDLLKGYRVAMGWKFN